MFAPPSIQLTQWDHGGWTYVVTCVKNVPIPAPPQRLRFVKNNRSQKAIKTARLRSRSQKSNRKRNQEWPDSAHADSDHHWLAAAPDNCVASHGRRPTHSQSNSWGNFTKQAYGPCPNNQMCHNDCVKLRSNMLWCTACWASMSPERQAQCHREANTTE